MLTLELSPNEMQQLEQASAQAGMNVRQYVLLKLFGDTTHTQSSTNPMVQRALSIDNPSVLGDGVSIQREIRNEWD